MVQGTANPCHFLEKGRNVRGVVQGDDFLFNGTKAQLTWLRHQFEKEYECKIELIGHGKGLQKSAGFLNRVISFSESGIEFEPDQRLVEAIVEGLGVL